MTQKTPRTPAKSLSTEARRNLKTGMKKLYQPTIDSSFDDLLAKIARKTKR